VIVLAIRLLLAAVFATAAVAKTAGPRTANLRAFGIPHWLLRPAAVGLPAAELAVAVALLPSTTARYAALAAVG
jgi:uncharacterized membrane protein YphA (DoxX/SURF4 family)